MITATTITPRPHQQQALDAIARTFQTHDRAQVRMACGTGKTLLGLWHATRTGARTVVVLEPSIALVAQTVHQWRQAATVPLRILAVCSDPTSARGRDEIGQDGWDPYAGRHDTAGVTTQADVVALFLDGAVEATPATRATKPSAELTVVVSTYHSGEVVSEALRLTDRTRQVDLMVADEAHRLAGHPDRSFAAALRDSAIRARHRLFQTATPIVLANLAGHDQLEELAASGVTGKALSMDDHSVFGPVAYELNAGQAIEQGLLADYRVVVAQPTHALGHTPVPERAAVAALADTVRRFGVRRVLTFHNRVASAHAFAQRLSAAQTIGDVPVRAFAVDGTTSEHERRRILSHLDDRDGRAEVVVVCSAQVLREGVDVPAVDAVLFADPRSSAVAIVQAVGRVLRTHPGKSVGTIVIPVVLDDGDDQEQLAASGYAHVWRVLRGLRAHDARVAIALDRARASSGAGTDLAADPQTVPWLHVLGDQPGAVITRLVQRSSAMWELYYGRLSSTVQRLGSAAAVVAGHREGDLRVGQWIVLQRILHRDGVLDIDRAARLEQLPGWRWSAAAASDDRTVATLHELARHRGTVAENPSGPSAYAGLKDGRNRPLSRWIATQLGKHHDGELDAELTASLEQLPGWSWQPLSAIDTAGAAALRRFAAWENHCDVPADHVEDGVALGTWLTGVRRRKIVKQLPPAVEAAVLAAAPATGAAGARRFSWLPAETQWGLGVAALRSFLTEAQVTGGGLDQLCDGHEQLVDGLGVRLYQWVARVRYLHNRGQLDDARVAELNDIHGWNWARPRGTRQPGRRQDLGQIPHGRRGFYAGCRCGECLDSQRRYETAAAAASRHRRNATGTPCADAAAHLHALVAADTGRLATPGAIAAAAAVSVGLVRGILDGTVERCYLLHHRTLSNLTLDDVAAVRSISRSRGRLGIAGGEFVDPGPTWSTIDALRAAGWTMGDVCEGLGYRRSSSLPFTRERITARQSAQADNLRGYLDDLGGVFTPPTPPPPTTDRPARRAGPAGHERDAFATDLLAQGYTIAHVARTSGLSVAVVTSLASTAA